MPGLRTAFVFPRNACSRICSFILAELLVRVKHLLLVFITHILCVALTTLLRVKYDQFQDEAGANLQDHRWDH